MLRSALLALALTSFSSLVLAQQSSAFFATFTSPEAGLVRFEEAKGKDMHAAICCEDSIATTTPDTTYSWRTDRAGVYRNNFLGGRGIHVYIHHRVVRQQTRAELATQLFARRSWQFAQANPASEAYSRDGIELRYKDSTGTLYSTAWGPQPKAARFRAAAVYQPGKAIGGFGTYEYILSATFQKVVFYSRQGKKIQAATGSLRLGIWGADL